MGMPDKRCVYAEKGGKGEPMDDLISRQAAIDALRYAQHRFTVADEAGGMGSVKWSEDVIYFAAAERVLSELPSAQPEQQISQMRGWVCPVCGRGLSPYTSVCPCNNGKGWEITC